MPIVEDDPFGPIKPDKPIDDSPEAREVNKAHKYSDRDKSPYAQHHTLGSGRNQASPGDHTHNGGTSKEIGGGEPVGTLAEVSAFLRAYFNVV